MVDGILRRGVIGVLAGVVCLAGAVPAHAGVRAAVAGADDQARATQCLTLAIAYEAGYEPLAGRQAVGEVILNRMHSPDYPKSVCGVVFQGSARRTGCQFTFTCDGALRRPLPAAVLTSAREVAERLITGDFTPQVAGATHYHANYVSPYWAPTLVRLGRIGAHIFYRTPAGSPLAAHYTPVAEPGLANMGSLLLATDPNTQRRSAPTVVAREQAPPAEPAAFSPWGLAAALPRAR